MSCLQELHCRGLRELGWPWLVEVRARQISRCGQCGFQMASAHCCSLPKIGSDTVKLVPAFNPTSPYWTL